MVIRQNNCRINVNAEAMKANNFLQAAILIGIIAFAASCRTSRTDRPTRDYPTTTKRYPYPEPYPEDRRIVVTRDPNPQNLPPGQAKKIYGGKSAKPYAPGQRKKMNTYSYRRVPLIITRTPDIIINRNNDGRYYHRNDDGFLYWQGYDKRLYIDKAYLSKIKYDDNEYKEWSNKGKTVNSNSSKSKGNSQKNTNGKGNSGKGSKAKGHH
jgi:hypothetical protein